MKEKNLKIGALYISTITFALHPELYLYRGKIFKTTSFGGYTVYRFCNLSTMRNIDMASTSYFEPL